MKPREVPDEFVQMMADAEWDAPEGCSAIDSYRTVLAAVLPEHERQVRDKVAQEQAERLAQTMASWSAQEDDYNSCGAGDEHNCHVVGGESAFAEAIKQVREIARGGDER